MLGVEDRALLTLVVMVLHICFPPAGLSYPVHGLCWSKIHNLSEYPRHPALTSKVVFGTPPDNSQDTKDCRRCLYYPWPPSPSSPPTVLFLLLQLLRAMSGESDIVECAFVESSVTGAAYFSTPLQLGVSVLYIPHTP